jgi:selenocysteine-specific elongation factor
VTGARLTLGTAGHIDHGKTRLVQALTGTDTDRLPEEKRRGISIALGYAQLELPDGTRLSVVDVPGHERFVRTMVAGATGIDLFLLVVDAGEGPKPQTHEHLEILRLLGIEHGVVALTKVDAVDELRVQASEGAVQSLLSGREVVRVSAVDGTGLEELVAALGRAAAAVDLRRHDGRARLYVDRSFSLPGAGRIVTGTLWSGSVAPGDRLHVLPDDYEVRVRSVEVHGDQVERAAAGQRVALAVVSERKRRPEAGDAIVAPGSVVPSYRLDVALDPPEGIEGDGGLTVCHGTSAVPGRLVRAHGGRAQLRLAKPLAAARGDRVVLRRQTTVGGARVLDPNPPRRIDEHRLELLERGDIAALVEALVDEPVETAVVKTRLGLADGDLEGLDGFVRVDGWLLSAAWLEAARAGAWEAVEARAGEVDPGLTAAELLGAKPWTGAVAPLLDLEPHLGKLYVPGRLPDASAHGGALAGRLAEAGLEPVAVEDSDLGRQLEREGLLVRLGGGLAISREAYDEYRRLLVEEFDSTGTITLAAFRDRAGISRRVAQLVLERFDADRLTLRVGDERRLRRSARL